MQLPSISSLAKWSLTMSTNLNFNGLDFFFHPVVLSACDRAMSAAKRKTFSVPPLFEGGLGFSSQASVTLHTGTQ